MEKSLNKIHEKLLSIGFSKKELDDFEKGPEGIAQEIMFYAHDGVYRVNGDSYVTHPLSVHNKYWKLIYQNQSIDNIVDSLSQHDLPIYGVTEVCYLHDVVEDTDFSFDDVRNIFAELGYGKYYDKYIDVPLRLITHDKSVNYEDYIDIVMENKTAALVKMLDLQDNANLLSLNVLDEKNLERSLNYLRYIYKINNKYHFIEIFNGKYKECARFLKAFYHDY